MMRKEIAANVASTTPVAEIQCRVARNRKSRSAEKGLFKFVLPPIRPAVREGLEVDPTVQVSGAPVRVHDDVPVRRDRLLVAIRAAGERRAGMPGGLGRDAVA